MPAVSEGTAAAANGGDSTVEDKENLNYILQHNMHHLFEKLAGEVLVGKPANLIPFLISALQKMEGAEAGGSGGGAATEAAAAAPSPVAKAEPEAAPEAAPEPEKKVELSELSGKPKYDPTQEDRRPINGDEGKKLLKVTIAVFGIDGAGKTTMLNALSGTPEAETTPTVGFTPIRMRTEKVEIVLYDLGGGKRFRNIWSNYFADVHGVLYVIDASDKDTLEESKAELHKLASDERVSGKPICVISNKHDLPAALPSAEVAEALQLSTLSPSNIVDACALQQEHPAHANIEAGMKWLLEHISDHYEDLARRVKEQLAIEKERRRQRMEEQRERVRLNKEKERAERVAAGLSPEDGDE
eukprot:Rhum_TRINITY_DN19379_c0_g1::Rhum_TRINITY_DN19379_c0_g1_i1::g.169916::m.169916/K07962/ARL13B, ARL2L1; ADP-ribosylation factor-like protein 13B